MYADYKAFLALASLAATTHGLDRLERETISAYWLRFLNGRWLIYWHERVIADFPSQNAVLAVAFLRQKQSEQCASQESQTQKRKSER